MPDPGLVEQFLNTLSSHKSFSENTLAAYRSDLAQFEEYLRSGHGASVKPVKNWADVSRDNVMSFVLYLKERGCAQTTVARKLAAVKSFFRYLALSGAILSNPIDDMASLHVDRALPHTVSTTDLDKLMNSLNSTSDYPEDLRDRAMLALLYATGLRAGEMVALDLSNLNIKSGTIATVAHGKSRQILINSALALETLQHYLQGGRPALARARAFTSAAAKEDPEEALFLNHRGQRLTRQGFWLILKAHARSAGLGDITPHILRHSFAAQKLKGGVDIRDLQQMLGHANVSTTQIYTRIEGDKRHKRRSDMRKGQRKAG